MWLNLCGFHLSCEPRILLVLLLLCIQKLWILRPWDVKIHGGSPAQQWQRLYFRATSINRGCHIRNPRRLLKRLSRLLPWNVSISSLEEYSWQRHFQTWKPLLKTAFVGLSSCMIFHQLIKTHTYTYTHTHTHDLHWLKSSPKWKLGVIVFHQRNFDVLCVNYS